MWESENQDKSPLMTTDNFHEIDGLVTALEAAFRAGGVHLIAAPIDYSENTRVLIDELQSAHSTARRSSLG